MLRLEWLFVRIVADDGSGDDARGDKTAYKTALTLTSSNPTIPSHACAQSVRMETV